MNAPQRYLALRFVVLFLTALAFVDMFIMLAIVGYHAYAPTKVAYGVLDPMMFVLAGAAATAVVLGLVYALLVFPQHRNMVLMLTLIVLGLLGAHLYTINNPDTANCNSSSKGVQGCIMDEVYYVPAAQTMLSGEKCAPYQDNCNMEHPFLNKAFIAAGMAIFGDTTFGWRIFNVLMGTFSIALLFGICWVTTKNKRMSLYAAFLLAFETLFFVHSSIAVIDVGAIFFGLLGFLFYFADIHWWKFDRFALASIALGLGILCKETAVFLFMVLLIYHVFFGDGRKLKRVLAAVEISLSTFVVFAVGMQIYDSLFGTGVASTFIGQTEFILRYGGSLTVTPSVQACLFNFKPTDSCGWVDSLLGNPITPLNWITYYSPVGYLVTKVNVTTPTSAYSYISAGYYGITNQFEVWFLYFWAGYLIYLWWKTRGKNFDTEQVARDFKLTRMALIWFLVVFVSYCALFLYGRITYPYYIIEAVPALSIGGAYLLSRRWFPNHIAYIFLIGVFVWFFIFYPDKAFLPTQVRVWLGH